MANLRLDQHLRHLEKFHVDNAVDVRIFLEEYEIERSGQKKMKNSCSVVTKAISYIKMTQQGLLRWGSIDDDRNYAELKIRARDGVEDMQLLRSMVEYNGCIYHIRRMKPLQVDGKIVLYRLLIQKRL